MTSDRHLHPFDPGTPDERFRRRLRAAFVSGAVEREAEARERSVLRSALLGDRPAPAFRAELRERFASGALAEAAPEPARPIPLARRRRVPVGGLVGAALALAAAVALFVTLGLSSAGGWRLFNQRTPVLTVDGRPFDGDVVRPSDGGCELCNQGANLRLGYGDDLRLELAAGSTVRLPAVREEGGRLFVTVGVESGELVLVSRRPAERAAITIETPTALVHLMGTSVSVLPVPDGRVCVCVRQGRVEVTSRRTGERVEAGAGQRVLVTADGGLVLSERYDDERRLRNLAGACDDLSAGRFEAPDYARRWNVLEDY